MCKCSSSPHLCLCSWPHVLHPGRTLLEREIPVQLVQVGDVLKLLPGVNVCGGGFEQYPVMCCSVFA